MQRKTPKFLSKKILCSLKIFLLLAETGALEFFIKSKISGKWANWAALIQQISADATKELSFTLKTGLLGLPFNLLRKIDPALSTFAVTPIKHSWEGYLETFMRESPMFIKTGDLIVMSGEAWSVTML